MLVVFYEGRHLRAWRCAGIIGLSRVTEVSANLRHIVIQYKHMRSRKGAQNDATIT